MLDLYLGGGSPGNVVKPFSFTKVIGTSQTITGRGSCKGCWDFLGDYSMRRLFLGLHRAWPDEYWGYFNRAVELHMKEWSCAFRTWTELKLCDDRSSRRHCTQHGNAEVGWATTTRRSGFHTRSNAALLYSFFAGGHATGWGNMKKCISEGLRRTPTDTLSWSRRGEHKLAQNPPDMRGAVEDFRRALAVDRKNFRAWQNATHTLSVMGEAEEAVRCLTKALDFFPGIREFRSGRGVELARLGRRDEAYRDAVESLRNAPAAKIIYQVAGIYALNSQHTPAERNKTLGLLSVALGHRAAYIRSPA